MQTEWIKWWKDKYFLQFLLLAFLAIGISFTIAWFMPNYIGLFLVLCTCAIFSIPMRKMINLYIETIVSKLKQGNNYE